MKVIQVKNDGNDCLETKSITNTLVVGEAYSMDGVEKVELVEWFIKSHTMRYMVNGKEEIYYNIRTEQILTIKKLH